MSLFFRTNWAVNQEKRVKLSNRENDNCHIFICSFSVTSFRQTPRQAFPLDGLHWQGTDSLATNAGQTQLLGRGIGAPEAMRKNGVDPFPDLTEEIANRERA